ncbi:hypothetical protein HA466_0163190 [Hirschfeldia incana]|nr:hypothetical protein HA466_0163190 [Hirschfeldia incana]
MEVARRLEEELFKMAISKEEYMNQSTLESRLVSVIKGRQLNLHANSSMVGTMVPTTTALSHASMVTSSASASVGLGPSCNTVVPMDHDGSKVREDMRTLVELDKRQPCAAEDASKAKYLYVARRLEESLFQMANTRENYLN